MPRALLAEIILAADFISHAHEPTRVFTLVWVNLDRSWYYAKCSALSRYKHSTINPLLTAYRDADCAQPQTLHEHLQYQT